MAILDRLTEGIVNRSLKEQGDALLAKWEKTGLLEGLDDATSRNNMAVLLENQAKELLREASTMAAGDVEGFAAVAFPIVRRVFGNLIANQLVSVQPMSLPSGLIFFLDFQHTSARTPGTGAVQTNDSLYGGGRVGQEITGGVDLTGNNAESSFYNLNSGYASPTGSVDGVACVAIASGTIGQNGRFSNGAAGNFQTLRSGDADKFWGLCRYDPDISGSNIIVWKVSAGLIVTSNSTPFNKDNLVGLNVSDDVGGFGTAAVWGGNRLLRRLTQYSGSVPGGNGSKNHVLFFLEVTGSNTILQTVSPAQSGTVDLVFPLADRFDGTPSAGSANALGALVGQDTWGLESQANIPEIDIKVDSVSVTAVTKKLKAKWSPELAQDLNAYHNLDAEVELTSILSEQIALEIDREILEDLVKGATADTYYWSRRPGRFLSRDTGIDIGGDLANESLLGADFTGTVSEWYETLVETINDVSAQIHRKTLRGGANFIVVSPEIANILEFTAGFRASVTADVDTGTVGAVKVGAISKKWDVYVDPYFPRNLVLVGRKGSSFLESGYVYAPYVPLQVTPTIFGIEDFVPRKGVMTRYAKKMVRPDLYGLVIVKDLLG